MTAAPATPAEPDRPRKPVTTTKPGRAVQALRLRHRDHEFLPAALEILETPLSPIRVVFIPTICLFAVVALAWAYLGRVDIIATAQGKIQAVGRTKTIEPLETGRVLRVNVENGRHVEAGETLVELDAGEALADESTLESALEGLRAEALRRGLAIARASGAPAQPIRWDADTPAGVARRETRVLDSDLAQLASTVASLGAQQRQKTAEADRLTATIAAQQVLIATLKQRVDMRSELFSRNAESKASVIDAQESLQTQQTNLASQRGQLEEARAGVQQAQRDIEKTYAAFVADNSQKLAEAERQIAEDEQKIAKARLKTAHMRLASPIAGVVQGLTVTSIGQVVSTGEQIMQIVPEGSPLEIESYLPNGDVGFVKPGQPAVVKVESFPFTDYGTLDATVLRVARDAIPQPEAEQHEQNPVQSQKSGFFGGGQRTQNLVFPVTLRLARQSIAVNGADVDLVPGMAVTVEVKTGTRRILSYLFSPLVEVVSTAMRER